jgi:hypothetical protein
VNVLAYSGTDDVRVGFILVLFSFVYAAAVGKAVTSDERIYYFAALQAPLSG